jgi:hypothetical protein
VTWHINPLGVIERYVKEVEVAEAKNMKLVHEVARPDSGWRSMYGNERLFDSSGAAVAWVADEVDLLAGRLIAAAADLRRQAEVTV